MSEFNMPPGTSTRDIPGNQADSMHTCEPWTVDACEDANGFSTLRVYDGSEHGDTAAEPIATVFIEANAQRIVACVNACDGWDTEELIRGTFSSAIKHKAYRDAVRSALRAALEDAPGWVELARAALGGGK